MRKACDEAAKRIKPHQKRNKYWWNDSIRIARETAISKRRIMTRANKNGNEEEKEQARVQYRIARRKMREEIKKAKFLAWQELIDTIDKDPWGKPYRIVMAKLKRNAPTPTEMMRESEVRNIVRNLFPNNYHGRQELELEEEDEWDRELEIDNIQVMQAIKGKKGTATAPGPDGITKRVWKIAPVELMEEVKILYNKCLRMGTFPRAWKRARLLLIPKKKEW